MSNLPLTSRYVSFHIASGWFCREYRCVSPQQKQPSIQFSDARLHFAPLRVICHLHSPYDPAPRFTDSLPTPLAPMSSEGPPKRCDVCGRGFRTAKSLSLHQQVHQGLTCCALCGKVSSRLCNLRRHMVTVHGMTQEEVLRTLPDMRQGARWM